MTLLTEHVQPDESQVRAGVDALPAVRDYLDRHGGEEWLRLADDGGADAALPRGLVELLAQALALLADGRVVALVPPGAEMDARQAADVLHVSREYLERLLDEGEIKPREVVGGRRVRAADVLEYRRHRRERTRRAADELAALDQELGLV